MIEIYTDGSCKNNGAKTNKGGNGYIVLEDNVLKDKFIEFSNNTTNNREELKAIINALNYCKENYLTHIDILTDSQYCQKGASIWSLKWKKFGWKKSKNASKQVKNVDLWEELNTLNSQVKANIQWVKGHSDNPYNTLIDQLIEEIY